MKKIFTIGIALLTLVSCNMDFYRSDVMTSNMLKENPDAAVYTTDGIYSLFKDNVQYRGKAIDGMEYVRNYFQMTEFRGDNVCLSGETSDPLCQQIRYSDILTYSISLPEEIQDVTVPKLILQPLIENALYHGIKNRRGRGVIQITGEKQNDDILLQVRDNGAGMTEEQLQRLQAGVYEEHHSGLGLKNVHQRIRLYCGEPYGLTFESKQGIGTTVTVLLPSRGVKAPDQEGAK